MGGPAPALPPGLSTLPTEPRDTTAARASHGGFFTRATGTAHSLLHQFCYWLIENL